MPVFHCRWDINDDSEMEDWKAADEWVKQNFLVRLEVTKYV